MEVNFEALIPEIYLTFCVGILLILGTTNEIKGDRGNMMGLSIISLFYGSQLSLNGVFSSGALLNGTLVHDSLTITGKVSLFLVGALCLIASQDYLCREKIISFEISIFTILVVLGLGLLLSAQDLISLYLALELQSLSLYVLAAYKKESAYSTEAGLKYFVIGAFSSGLFLFGASLIQGQTGSTNFEDLGRLTLGMDWNSKSLAQMCGLSFVSTGLLFKLAAAPMHAWSPDVQEGAPTASTLIFAALPKLAILIVLVRLYYTCFFEFFFIPQTFLIITSAMSLVVAVLGALSQRRIKRFLAQSSIGHVGFLLLALSCGTLEGVQGMILYTFIYIVISLSVWTTILSTFNPISRTGTIKQIDDLSSFQEANPLLAFTLAIIMFSMAGIPPLAGFCAKLQVLFAAMESSSVSLALLAVLTSVVGAFYYLRWIKVLQFWSNPHIPTPPKPQIIYNTVSITEGSQKAQKLDFWHQLHKKYKASLLTINCGNSQILAVSAIFLFLFFAYPTPLLLVTHQMALTVSFLYS